MLLRIAKILGIAVLILIAALGGLYYAFVQKFAVTAPAPDYPKPATALQAQSQDLDYFGKLMALDRSFSPAARARAQERLDQLKALPDPLPPARQKVALMQIMALADNGHSKVQAITSTDQAALGEPIRVTRFSDGFYVMRARPAYRALLGSRIEAIDGTPFDQVLQKLESLRGGTQSWRRENAASLIVLHDTLYGLGIARDPAVSNWTMRRPDGEAVTLALTATPLGKTPNLPVTTRWLSPEPLKGGDQDWISYRPASGRLPDSLGDPDRHFARFAAGCAVAIRLQAISDMGDQKLAPFLESTQAALNAHPPCAAIVDLRGNGGGDYTQAWGFAHALPKLVPPAGRIYVLTDAGTFSAAITTTAFLKDAGGDRVVIVGEPVGDRLSFYGEGRMACLPNSKICVNYQLGKHDYAKPCQGPDCYWVNWLFPVRVKSLEPNVTIPRSFAAWNQGHDPAYEWVLKAVGALTHA